MRPGSQRERVVSDKEIECGLEEARGTPAGNPRTEAGMVPAQATETDEPVKECQHEHEAADVGDVLGMQGALEAQVGLPVTKAMLNGMITNDKFCVTRWGELQLSWWRRPCGCDNRLIDPAGVSSQAKPSLLGRNHETAMGSESHWSHSMTGSAAGIMSTSFF